MRIAFIGCGFVADYYAATLTNHPQIELVGVFDKDEERAINFSDRYNTRKYNSLSEIVGDKSIAIIVNLTNARAHYAITKACLEAGKHVYSEKPLATEFAEAEQLFALATERSLQISCAPANLLGEAAQTVWKLLRDGTIGTVRLAYAELDDGPIHQSTIRNLRSSSGVAWPFQDEFETGCTLEHAAYYLGWLTAFFGPAQKVLSSFASYLVPNKIEEDPTAHLGDDFSVSCIAFSSGLVARLTCSILAPVNHSLMIVGSEGVLTVEDCWQLESPIYIQTRLKNAQGLSRPPYFSEKKLVKLL